MNTQSKTNMLNEMNHYPYYLFINNPDKISKKIASLPWNCVFTTSTNLEKTLSLFTLPNRNCRSIETPDDFIKTPNKKNNLNIVFLNGTKNIENLDFIQKMAIKSNISKFFEIFPENLSHFGSLVFDSIEFENSIIEKIQELVYRLRNKSSIFFNVNQSSFFENELYKHKETYLITESIETFFNDTDLSLYSYSTDDNTFSENQFDFFINKQKLFKSKSQYSDFFDNFYLMTDQEVNKIDVPEYLRSNYFHIFLQNSANDYEWYGYQNNFNYERNEEKKLFDTVQSSLKKVNSTNVIFVYGQTGSGKTIAINNIAYKIYSEHEYPVIYLKKAQIDYIKNSENYFSQTLEYEKSSCSLLDDFMKDLEDFGAKNILLIWDLSLYPEDYNSIYQKLEKYLHNRGRNFVLLCTGYEKPETVKKISLFNLTPFLSEPLNIENFIKHIEYYAGLEPEELKSLQNFIAKNNQLNLFSVFYHFFSSTHQTLTEGVHREAEISIDSVISHCSSSDDLTLSSMQIALMKAGLVNKIEISKSLKISNTDIQNLLTITAICCENGVSLPSSLALKILPELQYDILKNITSIPFFIFTEENDDFTFSIRSKLEAQILLNSFNIDIDEKIKRICQLINKANLFSSSYGANREIKCIADLLHNIGPTYKSQKQIYMNSYKAIINVLKLLHNTNQKIDIRIILIEINYIRECYTEKLRNRTIDNKEFDKEMEYIIKIGDSYSAISEQSKDFNYIMIKVETANARYALSKSDPTNFEELKRAKQDAESVFAMYDNQYSYTIWFQTCNKLYENTKNYDYLAEMLNKIELLKSENENIEEDFYLTKEFATVNEYLSGTSNDYINSLINKGNPNGVFLKATKYLAKNNLNLNDYTQITGEQAKKFLEMKNSIFTENVMTLVYKSPKCLWLYIKLCWLLADGKGFHLGEKELTCISKNNWSNLLGLCQKFLAINNAVNSDRVNLMIEYLEALCFAQLEEYTSALNILNNIRELSESYYLPNRVYSRHMLCKENGEIRTFTGRIKVSSSGKISVYINEIKNGNVPIFCNPNNLRNFQAIDGKTDSNFQIGIGIMGFSVFHGYVGGKNE